MDIATEQLDVPDLLAPSDLCHPNCDNLRCDSRLGCKKERECVCERESVCVCV